MQVYEKVRTYLDINNLKYQTIADLAHIPTVSFCAMLNGKRKMYADDLRAICIALDVSADTFIVSRGKVS